MNIMNFLTHYCVPHERIWHLQSVYLSNAQIEAERKEKARHLFYKSDRLSFFANEKLNNPFYPIVFSTLERTTTNLTHHIEILLNRPSLATQRREDRRSTKGLLNSPHFRLQRIA